MIEKLKNNFLSGKIGLKNSSKLNILTQLLVFGFQFVCSVILARKLLPAGRGQYAILVLIPSTIYTLGNLGLTVSISYLSAKNPGKATVVNANNLFCAFILSVIYSTAISVAYLCNGLGVLSDFLSWKHIVLINISLFFLFFVNYSQAFLLGQNYIPARNFIRFFEALFFFAFLFFMAIIGRLGLWDAFLGWFITRGLSCLFSIFLLLKLRCLSFKPDFRLLLNSLKIGGKAFFATVAGFIILRSDIYLLEYFKGDAATGIYSIAASLSFLLLSVPESISSALFPHIMKLEHVEKKDGTAKTLLIFRLTYIVTGAIAFIGIVGAPFLIKLIYGPQFGDSVYPFMILAFAVTIGGCSFVLDAQLYARSLFWIKTILSFIAAIMNIVLNILLIPKYSIVGAALSSLVSYGFFGITLNYLYCRSVQCRLSELVPGFKDFSAIADLFKEQISFIKRSRQ